MKLYAPAYYQQFRCIADKCRHSCCKGWEIDIDEDTLQRYAALKDGYGNDIRQSIDTEDTPHFRLLADERCPHLDEHGLCRIIRCLGEAYLCDICREHPRFYNVTSHGMEVGLGMACEEAARLILCSDDYASIEEIGIVAGSPSAPLFNPLPLRTELFSLLADKTMAYETKLSEISKRYDLSLSRRSDDEWRTLLGSLEFLDEAHTALFRCYSSASATPIAWQKSLERALAYFIFRHTTTADSPSDFRAALGLSLLCERLLASLVQNISPSSLEQISELARILSEEIEYSEDNTLAIKDAFFTAPSLQ